jgi:uncharacterized protein (DUF2249 family)
MEGILDSPVIDLQVFAPRYRQALLFAMIEGLESGKAFCFKDDRDSREVEEELQAAGLVGYNWTRKNGQNAGDAFYFIEKEKVKFDDIQDSCCGCGCTGKKESF